MRYMLTFFVGIILGSMLHRSDPAPVQPAPEPVPCVAAAAPVPEPTPLTLPTPTKMDCSAQTLECFNASSQMMNQIMDLRRDLEGAKTDAEFWHARYDDYAAHAND